MDPDGMSFMTTEFDAALARSALTSAARTISRDSFENMLRDKIAYLE